MFNGRAMAPRVNGQPTTVNVTQLISDWNNVLRMTAAKLAVQTVLGGATGASWKRIRMLFRVVREIR